ncbi:uncharacterized protein MYCFIDRAFT_179942 [Pseudocercospora fijiensis CIRAD86]|uniref:Uncharacterized protein n=1 Tax=Pseudocercospora fijiensis (strain CIRAD86) TaxID=383855 RepID=M2YHW1_PSEFD|nr:uncharacterized protein MYCFIDRAFT_179942 [Pseudocercospora fijiensis CIRAD86]EME77370.1 hypothetical protein MYCFIDRAFT_179942 [Pseudocercospora fijiensis CIRAD86]
MGGYAVGNNIFWIAPMPGKEYCRMLCRVGDNHHVGLDRNRHSAEKVYDKPLHSRPRLTHSPTSQLVASFFDQDSCTEDGALYERLLILKKITEFLMLAFDSAEGQASLRGGSDWRLKTSYRKDLPFSRLLNDAMCLPLLIGGGGGEGEIFLVDSNIINFPRLEICHIPRNKSTSDYLRARSSASAFEEKTLKSPHLLNFDRGDHRSRVGVDRSSGKEGGDGDAEKLFLRLESLEKKNKEEIMFWSTSLRCPPGMVLCRGQIGQPVLRLRSQDPTSARSNFSVLGTLVSKAETLLHKAASACGEATMPGSEASLVAFRKRGFNISGVIEDVSGVIEDVSGVNAIHLCFQESSGSFFAHEFGRSPFGQCPWVYYGSKSRTRERGETMCWVCFIL